MLGGVLHLATILAIRRGNEKTQESACVRCYMAQQNNEQLSDISKIIPGFRKFFIKSIFV